MPRRDSDSDDSHRGRSRRKKTKKKSRRRESGSSSNRSSSSDRLKSSRHQRSRSRERSKPYHKSSHVKRRSHRSRSHESNSSSNDSYHSKSKKHSSYGRERSRRSRSRSRTRNPKSSKHSSSSSPKKSKTKESSHKQDKELKSSSKKNEAELIRDKLEAALKAAAVADAQLREKGLLPEASSKATPTLTVDQQLKRAQAIEDIKAEGFTPQEFLSSRSWGNDSTKISIDGSNFNPNNAEMSSANASSTMDDWKTNPEKLVHISWFQDLDTKALKWKKKLLEYRGQKFIDDTTFKIEL